MTPACVHDGQYLHVVTRHRGSASTSPAVRMALASSCATLCRLPHRDAASRRVRCLATHDVVAGTHVTPDGVKLEVRSALPQLDAGAGRPLLFVHGSGHAAWCWSEYFLPYFAERGNTCYAISLRGQGASNLPPDAPKRGFSLSQHTQDPASFISTLPAPPVLVGHSFGGLASQMYLRDSARAGTVPQAGQHPPVR